MTTTRPKATLRWLFHAPSWLYRWHCGWLLGHRFLLLTHVGRRTGRHHQTILEVMEYRNDDPEIVVMSGFGRGADWFRNIQADPRPVIAIGSCRFTASHRILDETEAAAVLARYERHNRWITPIIRRVLSRLVGWHYDGSDAARRRVVAQLPLVAFRPRTPPSHQ